MVKNPIDAARILQTRVLEDDGLRERLISKPGETIETEFGVALSKDQEIRVLEDTYSVTHVVLPPRDKFSVSERQEAKTGTKSLEFLRRTLHDPAPPIRPPVSGGKIIREHAITSRALVRAGRESILRGLDFLESTITESGVWRCIRSNVAYPNIPRHYEKPPFVSAFCVLALERCSEPVARDICEATRAYLVDTIEHPGLWRYYRHLPPDLDSTAVCSLVLETHPWMLLGRNVPHILANRDEKGRFMTWALAENEPDLVSTARIEADPVVNANLIAYLGDHPETREAQRWLEELVAEGRFEDASDWYPDQFSIYYAITRAMIRGRPALERLGPNLADRILGLSNERGEFGNILQTAQALSALDNIGSLERIDVKMMLERFLDSQHEDGSWPELFAFGEQYLKWGHLEKLGYGSESVTSAFCIEAMERLLEILKD